jgi:Arc/MetJ-type ribon-helix-helix transcriptional regulator
MPNDISPDNARYIAEAVERGVYASDAEALDEAVTLLKKRDQLRSDILFGMSQADKGELLPGDEVFERLEQRAREIEDAANKQ